MKILPLLLAAGVACSAPQGGPEPPDGAGPDAEARPAVEAAPPPVQPSTLLERHDFGRRTARFDLPGRLDEVSGLATGPDGRLFGHDDERGRVHEILVAEGEVGKRWDLGPETVRDDFEGLAIVGSRFFLVSSRGLLYEFLEADDREQTPFRVTDMGIGAHCEVEGLDYDPVDDALLFACKVSTPDRSVIVVHRTPLDPARARMEPLRIAKSQLAAHGVDPEFDPSGIAVDPGGTLVLISGRHERILEADRSGRVLAVVPLSRRRHPQPEGIAFGPDGSLYVADERNGQDARVTVYARREAGQGMPR